MRLAEGNEGSRVPSEGGGRHSPRKRGRQKSGFWCVERSSPRFSSAWQDPIHVTVTEAATDIGTFWKHTRDQRLKQEF